jgi:hypothetical protein
VATEVEYLAEALEEAEAAARWYAERSPAAATRFSEEVSRAVQRGERGRGVSTPDLDGLTDDVWVCGILLGERPIGFEHETDGFFEIRSGLLQGSTLGIRARELFDKTDVAFGHLAEDGGKLQVHVAMIPASGSA